jgi:hypothetical protein
LFVLEPELVKSSAITAVAFVQESCLERHLLGTEIFRNVELTHTSFREVFLLVAGQVEMVEEG